MSKLLLLGTNTCNQIIIITYEYMKSYECANYLYWIRILETIRL